MISRDTILDRFRGMIARVTDNPTVRLPAVAT